MAEGAAPSPASNPAPRTPADKKTKKALKRAEKREREKSLVVPRTAAQQRAAQLAQVVNLHIAGFSLGDIGGALGMTADEVDRLLQDETSRYVRTQPALRTYVRNYVSGKYNELLGAVWEEATDRKHPQKLENMDRAMRVLDRMAKLHGADAPVQSEVKIETAPEAVEEMVRALSKARGVAYDVNVFDDEDVVDAEVVEDPVSEDPVIGIADAVEDLVSGNESDPAWTEGEDL